MNISLINPHNNRHRYGHNVELSYSLLGYLFIVFLVGAVYFPALDNTFVHWDDQYYVTENIYITQPTFEHFCVLLTKAFSLNYHPLTMLTLWANSYVFGVEDATPFIITNVLIHTLSSLILFKFLIYVTREDYIVSLVTAVIFAIHPMHVESVVWVSERKDVLYGLFFISALFAYTCWVDSKKSKYWMLAFFLFLLSCLSKAMAVSIVPCLFLIDILRGYKWYSIDSILRKTPFILLGLLIGLIAIDVQSGGDFYGFILNTNIDQAVVDPSIFSLSDKFANAASSLVFYLKGFVTLSEMSPYHPYDWDNILADKYKNIIIGLFYGGGLIYGYFRNKNLFFGLSFFLATVLLVLQWIPVGSAAVADRYTYLPYIGLAYAIGHLLSWMSRRQIPRFIVPSIICVVVVLLSSTAYNQVEKWRDHTTLFSQAVDKYPHDSQSRLLLASGQWTEGNHVDAIENIEYAINELGLYNSDAFEKLANCYYEVGEEEKAKSFYNHSISLDSLNYAARYHRGLLIMHENPTQAILDFDICESSNFEYITKNIYGPRGICYGRIGDYEKAIADFTMAISIGENLAANYADRALTYELMGDKERAEKDRLMAEQY